MKTIKNISILIQVLIITVRVNGQDSSNFEKIIERINIKNDQIWGYAGITHLREGSGYFVGGKFQDNKNNIFGVEYYQFGETPEGGIFTHQTPNQIVHSITANLNYGYCINFETNFIKLIPILGVGYTIGSWRTDEQISGGGGGGSWFSFGGPTYIEVPFSGVSVSPQIDLIFNTSWGGIGLMLTHNTTFFIGNNYSSNDFAFHICIGKMR
ncbi:MAG: hypothetical protein ACHQK8_07930 [Bacteroidia bacterium]